MILAGNKKIKLFADATKVKAAYVGAAKVYPNSSLAVTQSLNFAAAGGSAALSIQVEDGQSWNLYSLPAGWSASATSGTGSASVTITAPNNTSTDAKGYSIDIISEDLAASCSVSQAAGAIIYETPIITAFGYPDIPASGGTVSPNLLTYQQVYTWNGVAGSGGVLTTGGTVYYSNTTGQVSAGSLGTEARGRTYIASVVARVDMNGKTGSNAGFDIYQAANSWWDGHIELYAPSTLIGAAGGAITLSWQLFRHWTSGAQNPVGPYGSLTGAAGGFSISGANVSAENRTTVPGVARSITVAVNYYGIISNAITITQQANNIESYNYQVVVVSSGSTIPWGGGNTMVSAKSQRAAVYTSGTTSGYENTTGQTISAKIVGSFTIGNTTNSGATYSFTVTAGANSSSAQRTGTVIFTGSAGGSDSVTVRQAAMPVYASWRYSSTAAASRYPEFFVNGNTIAYPTTRDYTGAVAYTRGNRTTYYDADLRADSLYDVESWFALGSQWGSMGSTFMGFTNPGGFMNGYRYSYATIPFRTSTPAGTTLNGIVLVQKSDGDYQAAGYPSWPSTSSYVAMFSEAEQTAMTLLAENGTVTDADNPALQDVDFTALAEKINAVREPDTNRYTLNEDGTWTVIPLQEP